jgi:hypothetical protein
MEGSIMIRWIIHKIIFFIGLVTLVLFLKNHSGEIGNTIGEWIAGREDNRIVQAVNGLVDSLSDGEGLADAVEVFRENLQG